MDWRTLDDYALWAVAGLFGLLVLWYVWDTVWTVLSAVFSPNKKQRD